MADPNDTKGQDPQQDPQADPAAAAQPETVTIPKTEFDAIKHRLDVFDQRITGMPQQAAAPVQQIPQGPTVADQIKEIDTELTGIDGKIDEAIKESKPVSDLFRKRDELNEKRTTIRINAEHIDPIRNIGFATIDQLSAEVVKGQMPHLVIPEIKADFDRAMNAIPQEQRISPAMRIKAYEMAVGMNVDKIVVIQKEQWQRETTDTTQGPGKTTGREQASQSGDVVPKPEDYLDAANLAAIQGVGKTVDQYYQGMGYANWADFWEKTGKEYFVGGEE